MSAVERDTVSCRVYGSRRQAELYVYLRDDVSPDDLPEALRARTGSLREVMALQLTAARRLARLDVQVVMAALRDVGYYVQLPPGGEVHGHLHFGD